MNKPNVIVICGPTASGKTKLAVELAKRINGEVISSDSMQIYKEMNIGTAKVTQEEACGVPHYLIDIKNPNERYSVADYKKDAEEKIEYILSKGKTPIICGGTGLYIDSLIYGIEFNETPVDLKFREELTNIAQKEGLDKLYQMAKSIDPEATSKISLNDQKRIIRIIEIYKETGKTKTQNDLESRSKEVKYNYHVFALNIDRQKLYNRIDLRVDIMIKQGLIQEVKDIYEKYKYFPTSFQGLGYKEVVEYLENKCSKEEMIEKIKKESRHYAKRQLTWFKKNKQTIWLNAEDDTQKNITTILEEISGEKG